MMVLATWKNKLFHKLSVVFAYLLLAAWITTTFFTL